MTSERQERGGRRPSAHFASDDNLYFAHLVARSRTLDNGVGRSLDSDPDGAYWTNLFSTGRSVKLPHFGRRTRKSGARRHTMHPPGRLFARARVGA